MRQEDLYLEQKVRIFIGIRESIVGRVAQIHSHQVEIETEFFLFEFNFDEGQLDFLLPD